MVLRPICASAVARFTAIEVLPVPPLPPVTAMTCTGEGISRLRSSARGMDTASIAAREHFVIGKILRLARQLDGARHQLMRPRRLEIVRNNRPVADVGDRQL